LEWVYCHIARKPALPSLDSHGNFLT